jgi:hypothetical protein
METVDLSYWRCALINGADPAVETGDIRFFFEGNLYIGGP